MVVFSHRKVCLGKRGELTENWVHFPDFPFTMDFPLFAVVFPPPTAYYFFESATLLNFAAEK